MTRGDVDQEGHPGRDRGRREKSPGEVARPGVRQEGVRAGRATGRSRGLQVSQVGAPAWERRDQKLTVGTLPSWPLSSARPSATGDGGSQGPGAHRLPSRWARGWRSRVWGRGSGRHTASLLPGLSRELPATVTFGGGGEEGRWPLQGAGAGEIPVAAPVSREATCRAHTRIPTRLQVSAMPHFSAPAKLAEDVHAPFWKALRTTCVTGWLGSLRCP